MVYLLPSHDVLFHSITILQLSSSQPWLVVLKTAKPDDCDRNKSTSQNIVIIVSYLSHRNAKYAAGFRIATLGYTEAAYTSRTSTPLLLLLEFHISSSPDRLYVDNSPRFVKRHDVDGMNVDLSALHREDNLEGHRGGSPE